ncbi:hypothetical protein GCM10010193_37370 [Kitasatospora atroaurantiaca]|uniref:Uncharacterized protein n=1 Tax=Kitasatospora atroaurantiaca TaxID=285545 RepID=A0A561F1Z2_9ACTN|nr:hypothetical protein [Kitasatospora atroaurantiaca]TWE21886.1 hypothetical protein FB465_7128 [Kitasatospora atroaurantiaca]
MPCHRGAPLPAHPSDCVCAGTGYTHEQGERHLCLGFIEGDFGLDAPA